MASISTCFNLPPSSRFLSSSFSLRPPNYFPQTLQTLNSPRFLPKLRLPHARVPVVRASIDVAAAIRPGGVVESGKLPSDLRKRAMDAVDAYGRRVTIGDVASRADLKLNEAQMALQALAADTDSFLEAAGEYLVRVSFGTALIASIVLVYTTIIVFLSSRSDEDNGERRGRS